MLAFVSKSSRDKNDSDPINGKTTPVQGIMGVIPIANSNDSDHFSSLFSQLLGRHYQIRFYSIHYVIWTRVGINFFDISRLREYSSSTESGVDYEFSLYH